MILHAPVEEWRLCEALVAFFSTGFPLKKAQVVELRRPLVFNDLHKQEMLFDRRLVYQTLVAAGVPCRAKHGPQPVQATASFSRSVS